MPCLYVCLSLLSQFSQLNPRFVSLDLCFYRSTTKWIKSPLRKWTAWPTDLTVLSSGQISVWCGSSLFLICLSSFCWMCFSCGMKLNLDYLLEMLWEYLSLICIYTKKRGGARTHFYYYCLHLSLAHKCISSNLFQLKYFLFLSERPDFNDPIIMRRGSNVEHVVRKTSKNLLK